jgi:hypothetical protein
MHLRFEINMKCGESLPGKFSDPEVLEYTQQGTFFSLCLLKNELKLGNL